MNLLSKEGPLLRSSETHSESLSLVPLAAIPMLYHQYSTLRDMWGSDTLLPRDSPLDGKVVALGALTLLRGHISYPNRRMERVERAVADQRDWPPDVTLPFKVAYRSRKDPIWKRLMTYFESCRMVDSSVYEKIGGISESWLSYFSWHTGLTLSCKLTTQQ